MSCVYNGKIIESEQSKNSMGGTEMMRRRLLENIPQELLNGVSIHFSRVRDIHEGTKNILYCHDLAEDPENKILKNDGWKKFEKLVFVSSWQRDQYISIFGIPYSKCIVIHNAVEIEHKPRYKPTDRINIIYHTTPHRGLALVLPIFQEASKYFKNLHLDVFSSFGVYGWKDRDNQYQFLFDALGQTDNVTYHGHKDNKTVLEHLENSHIFLYPCVWKETSCISLIEAIRAGCLAIHPNYGALAETAASTTLLYDYSEDYNENANRCFNILYGVLEIEKNNNGWINKTTNSEKFSLKNSDIELFKQKWKSLLMDIKK